MTHAPVREYFAAAGIFVCLLLIRFDPLAAFCMTGMGLVVYWQGKQIDIAMIAIVNMHKYVQEIEAHLTNIAMGRTGERDPPPWRNWKTPERVQKVEAIMNASTG